MAASPHMHRITLVCSAHRENGPCNAGELLKIIQAIEPEVIFEEMRPSELESARVQARNSHLEAQALARYREFKAFRRVPVDRYEIPVSLLQNLKRAFDSVFDYVEQESKEYQLLNERNDECVRQHGFDYLNSDACDSVMTRLSEIEDMTIKEAGNPSLVRWLDIWRDLNLNREREMVRVIHEYCGGNAFDTGVFIVGAAHKMGIIKEIQRYSGSVETLIDWKFRP